MAQHILMKDQVVIDRVNKAIDKEPVTKYLKSLKDWAGNEVLLWDRTTQERADIEWLKHYDIEITAEDFATHKVYMVRLENDIDELKPFLQDEREFGFEVFEFENQRVIWWVI